MIKQIYDNRIDEILEYLKNKIIKEAFPENIETYVDNYVKIANIQIRTIETSQKQDNEIIKRLEKELIYCKNLENKFMILNNQSKAREENKVIINYLDNFLKGV